MKKLPEVNESFEDLYRMLIGPIKSKLLLTAIELGVFNQLSEPMSANVVVEAIGTHSENISPQRHVQVGQRGGTAAFAGSGHGLRGNVGTVCRIHGKLRAGWRGTASG